MRWKRLPRPLSTSAPVISLAAATSSIVISEPIRVAISPTAAALRRAKRGSAVSAIASTRSYRKKPRWRSKCNGEGTVQVFGRIEGELKALTVSITESAEVEGDIVAEGFIAAVSEKRS